MWPFHYVNQISHSTDAAKCCWNIDSWGRHFHCGICNMADATEPGYGPGLANHLDLGCRRDNLGLDTDAPSFSGRL